MLMFMLGISIGLLILPISSISIELGRHFREQRKSKKELAFEKKVGEVLDRRWLDATLLPPARPTSQPASPAPAPTHQPATDYVDEYW